MVESKSVIIGVDIEANLASYYCCRWLDLLLFFPSLMPMSLNLNSLNPWPKPLNTFRYEHVKFNV